MKDYIIGLLLLLVALAILMAVGLGTGWFGLVAGRPMATYAAETDRLVEQQSRRRIEGTNLNIGDLCLNMQTADPSLRKAFAVRIRQEANAYSGPLSAESRACVAQANSYAAAPALG